MDNLLLSTDSYKHSHFLQYPAGTERISSYIEARGDAMMSPVLFFGIQAFIEKYLANPINYGDIREAKELITAHGLPFNEAGWTHIVEEHGGYLPICIQSLPEGTLVPRGVPMVQVHNTDPAVPWLTSFIETALLRSIWYATNVATSSFAIKTILMHGMNATSDDPEAGLPFKLHDFGARGVSSAESAEIGGMAHLINFQGTDTLEAITAIRKFYADDDDYMPGFSIPASEHSTMTAWGQDAEANAYGNMMDQFGKGLFSIVSDSYDLANAVEHIFGEELKDKIEKLEGRLIVRPDSGDPVATPLAVLDILWNAFGGKVNAKGFKVLHPKVGVIQGDGMSFQTIVTLAGTMMDLGWSLDNIAFGMGGGLLQNHMRDDFSFAMKANAINYGSGWMDVQKKPATDPAKTSKAGRQVVYKDDEGFKVMREDAYNAIEGDKPDNLLKEVWGDSGYETPTFESIRERAHQEAIDVLKLMEKAVEQEEAAEQPA